MRIRFPFAGAFLLLLATSAYLGLTSYQLSAINDKVLHFLSFFVLTLTFYWILDTTRRRALNTTFLIITIVCGIGSEFLQFLLPINRDFDPLDIVANLIGSSLALGLCTLYHKRMLERKRKKKLEGYGIVDGGEEDLELGEGVGGQESGTVEHHAANADEEGESAEAWDEIGGEESETGDIGKLTPSTASAE
ncbi:MAG: hypothetical protein MMC33_006225 [Icmadophila ericetorum]|nr:hypothetical protein [Icmadophila ericetorum]